MPTSSAIQSKLKEHEQWLVGLRHDSCMTQAKIQTELEKQKGLVVNSSQLETYFRNLGQRKNLSRAEWITVFCALDSQKAFGRFFDFYLSGKQIDEQSLQRKRKHAKPARPLAPTLAAADQLLTRLPDGVTVELRLPQESEDAGQQHGLTPQLAFPTIPAASPDRETRMSLDPVPINNDSVSGRSAIMPEIGACPSRIGTHTTSTSTGDQAQLADLPVNMEEHPALTLQVPQDMQALIPSPAFEINEFEVLDIDYEDPYSFPGSNFLDKLPIRGSSGIHLPSPQYQGFVDQNNPVPADFDYASWTGLTSGQSGLELGLIEPARLLPENYGFVTRRLDQVAQATLFSTAEELLENVASLVSTEIVEGDFSGPLGSIGGPGLLFTDGFVQMFLFSVVNNFAGMRGSHKAGIMQLIKQHELLRSTILSHLKNGASTVFSIALAEKLLEPAIDAADPKTVHDLLELRLFKPDDIVCTDGLRRRTPLEKASRLRHFDIAVSLVRFGADVNKTYEDARSHSERGALECAIGLWGGYRPVDPRLVDLLRESGAVVSSRLVEAAIRWGDDGLIEKLISALSLSVHVQCFSQVLGSAAEYLRNDVGHRVIRQLIQTCRDAHDNACIHSRQHAVAGAMAKAARRKNEDLLYLLLPHGGQKGLDMALTAASRSGSHELVRGLLAHGARGDGPRCFLSEFGAQPPLNTPWLPPTRRSPWTTPLAEAIRGQDAELVDILSENGAWNQIGESGRLRAVMLAIAESGQSTFLHQVLRLVPNPDPTALTEPLSAVIICRHEEIALKLIEAGADVNGTGVDAPLLAALKIKSQSITWAILESEVELNHRKRFSEHPNIVAALEEATAWGDREVIKTLVFMGADINTYKREAPLSIAIKAGERSLIDLLINLGAELNADLNVHLELNIMGHEIVSERYLSPLAAAASVHDSETANYLLEHGADPADEEAILEAITPDRKVLDMILHSFSKRYPKGRTGFGGRVLRRVLQRHDEALLDVFLIAAFDVNSMAPYRRYEDSNSSDDSDDSEDPEDSEDSDDSESYEFHEDYGSATALGMAIKKYRGDRLELISKLLDAGGDVNMPTSERRQASSSPGSSRDPFDDSDKITVRQTALLDAIETGSLPLVEFLVTKGADVQKEAKLGLKRTPLQKACEVASPTIVDLLLGLDVDVNAAPAARGGATALQLAAKVGSMRIAKKLLVSGANVNAPGAQVGGRSAIEYAAEHGRLNMIPVLCNAVGGQLAAGQYESAIALAQKNGHPACAVLLRNLSAGNQVYIDAAAWQMPQGYDDGANVVGSGLG